MIGRQKLFLWHEIDLELKPLYFALQKGNLYFRFRDKSLHLLPVFANKCHPVAGLDISVYSTYGMPYETFWDEVYQLPAGYCLFFNSSSLDVRQWYEFDKSSAVCRNS